MVLMTTAALTLAGWRLNQEASPGKHNGRTLLQQTTYKLVFACVKTCETIHREMCSPYKFIFMRLKLTAKSLMVRSRD